MDDRYNLIGRSPNPDGGELAAKMVSLISVTVLSLLFGIKTFNVTFQYLSYSRWLVLTLYVISWAFTTASMILVTTNNGNYTSCFLSIMVCDIFYSGTKITIYAWLIEKVYIVSSARQTRWKTLSYRFHAALLLPYIAIFTLMLVFHVSELQDDGVCIIGLEAVASIPLLVYDFIINLYMTFFFVKPLIQFESGFRIQWKSSRLNEVALRTLVASIVCLFASFANVFALVMFNGRERGLLCLTCCTVDVTVNVITIHWVTSHAPGKKTKQSYITSSQNQMTTESQPKPYSNHAKSHTNKEVVVMEKFDENEDTISTESQFDGSVQESQSSRKSLTKI